MINATRKRWRLAIVVFIVILIASIGSYAYYVYDQLFTRIYGPLTEEDISPLINIRSTTQPTKSSQKTEVTKPIMEPFTMLLIGVDSRGERHSRSDSMFLAAVHPEQKRLALIPIPRDLYVLVQGRGMEKVNHAMFYGGVPLLKQTIEDYFNIPIQRYVTIDFEGFRKIIDEIGGIQIDVKKRMRYYDPADGTNINLKKGVQILDGEDALHYARYRRSNIARDDTDEERSARQIELIKAIIEQGKEKASIFRVFSFLDIAGDHIKTNFTKKEIETLLPIYRSFSNEQIETTAIVGEGTRLPYGKLNLFFYVVSEEEKERVLTYIQHILQSK